MCPTLYSMSNCEVGGDMQYVQPMFEFNVQCVDVCVCQESIFVLLML